MLKLRHYTSLNKMATAEIVLMFMATNILTACLYKPNVNAKSGEYTGIDSLREEFPPELGHNVYLLLSGTYIASHKYFGADLRYQAGKIDAKDHVFYKRFPVPAIRELDSRVVKVCEQGAQECLDLVTETAKLSGSMAVVVGKERSYLYEPFKNSFDAFLFKQSAMYFLCWYTKRRGGELTYSEGPSCLSQLRNVSELSKERRMQLQQTKSMAINDVREKAMKTDPFVCAELWFCPDPCYGQTTGGNYAGDFSDSTKHPDNPCRDLKNPECTVKPEDNLNFDGMVMNKLNVTCNCERDGFVWDSQFDLCVDMDECEEKGKGRCPDNKMCLNSVGSYICTCPKGYIEKSETGQCERVMALEQRVRPVGSEVASEGEEEDDIVSDLMQFVGVSTACHLTTLTIVIIHANIMLKMI